MNIRTSAARRTSAQNSLNDPGDGQHSGDPSQRGSKRSHLAPNGLEKRKSVVVTTENGEDVVKGQEVLLVPLTSKSSHCDHSHGPVEAGIDEEQVKDMVLDMREQWLDEDDERNEAMCREIGYEITDDQIQERVAPRLLQQDQTI